MIEWLSSYSTREKMVFGFAAIALLAIAVDALLLAPYTQRLANLQSDLEQGRADLSWMKSVVGQLPASSISVPDARFSGSLANFMDSEVRELELEPYLAQMTPVSETEIRIRYSAISFNRVIEFIARVKDKGLTVKDLRISVATSPGEVDSSLVLTTGN
ncbi:MAG: type II secretion system protein GspM [Gammaproteobacteria bacterium]